MMVVRTREAMLEDSKGERDRGYVFSLLLDLAVARNHDTSCSSCI